MSRALVTTISLGLLAIATPSLADDAAPAPAPAHATGGWVELGVESTSTSALGNHLTIGSQGETVAFGVELGGLLAAGNGTAFLFDVGPTIRYTLLATADRKTELVGIATLRVTLDLGDQGGPTTYTVLAGLDVRHWLDAHFAIGGGVLARASTVQQDSMGATGATDLGLAGAVHITGVF